MVDGPGGAEDDGAWQSHGRDETGGELRSFPDPVPLASRHTATVPRPLLQSSHTYLAHHRPSARGHLAGLVIVVPPWPWAIGAILLKTEAPGNSRRLPFVAG